MGLVFSNTMLSYLSPYVEVGILRQQVLSDLDKSR